MSRPTKKRREIERRSCDECGTSFGVTRSWRRFCSQRCQFKSWDRENPRQKRACEGSRTAK